MFFVIPVLITPYVNRTRANLTRTPITSEWDPDSNEEPRITAEFAPDFYEELIGAVKDCEQRQ